MGVLEGSDGRTVELLPRTLIGRSAACDLVIDDRSVSGEHAVIAWIDGAWQLRDLGSRNGSSLDGQALSSPTALAGGARIGFGLGPPWTLVEAAAPVPRAVALDDGAVVAADGDLLGLPDATSPEITVFRTACGGWVAEEGDGSTRPVTDRSPLIAGGRPWELRLPVLLAPTVEAGGGIDDIALEFTVSADEEHASWAILSATRRIDLGARAHTYLLLTLARARREDAEAGIEPSARGWRYADALARRLGITPEVLKVYVYRARRQLQEAGIVGAPALVERRAVSNQIRLGTDGSRILRG